MFILLCIINLRGESREEMGEGKRKRKRREKREREREKERMALNKKRKKYGYYEISTNQENAHRNRCLHHA